MILTEIKADNILKYSRLELTNLPSSGLIGVSGKNESGKTSLGEIICFGLFGRSFSLEGQNLIKLIQWGQQNCTVRISFIGKDNKQYQVIRHLDNDHVHGAQLFTEGVEQPIATGGGKVSEQISRLVGFEYREYVESFYLAQRELRTPSHNSRTIKMMAGIAPLEKVQEEITEELITEERSKEQTKSEIDTVDRERQSLNYDPDRFGRLEELKVECEELAEEKNQFLKQIESELSEYRTRYLVSQRIKTGKIGAVIVSVLSFFFCLEFLAVWWWVNHPVQSGALRGLIQKVNIFCVGGPENLPNASMLFFFGTIVFSTLFVLFSRKEQNLKSKTEGLVELLGRLANSQGDRLRDCLRRSLRLLQSDSVLDQYDVSSGAEAEVRQEVVQPEVEIPVDEVSELMLDPSQLSDRVHEPLEGLELSRRQLVGRQALLEKECELERELADQVREYDVVIDGLNEKIGEQDFQIRLYQQACQLLERGMIHLFSRFNSDVVNDTARAIPLFTGGHYEHLKIDDRLELAIFSNEKHDFMDFEELSSGTQRQIMLALRLAMAQKLIHTAATGNQFIFFDEPFAFFDRDRVLSTLKSLPVISEDISQIWIVAQEIDNKATLNLNICCDAASDKLILDCGGTS